MVFLNPFPLINVSTPFSEHPKLPLMSWFKSMDAILGWLPVACEVGALLAHLTQASNCMAFSVTLVKCNLEEKTYKIFGYKGKQVRDNIHSEDVAQFIDLFIQSPRSGEVYNLGEAKKQSAPFLEAFEICESHSGNLSKVRISWKATESEIIFATTAT